jgi:dTDP-4-dehydrorhamnose reductase
MALRRALAPLGRVVVLDRHRSGPAGDLLQPDAVAQAVVDCQPQVVVNAAAYTAVDLAEQERDRAHAINAHAVGLIAQAAEQVGAWMVHYSTDYVFDGSGVEPWVETDATAPQNVYGHSKRAGELALVNACRRHLVFRTSWVYGLHGNNFAKTMVKLALQREHLRVIDDQIGAPTGADLIADVTAQALHQVLSGAHDGAGFYHLAAQGECSWHAYASHVIERARTIRPDWGWRVQQIEAVGSDAFVTAARRPLNSRLDTTHLQQQWGLVMPAWQSGVDHMLEQWLPLSGDPIGGA